MDIKDTAADALLGFEDDEELPCLGEVLRCTEAGQACSDDCDVPREMMKDHGLGKRQHDIVAVSGSKCIFKTGTCKKMCHRVDLIQ